MTGGGAARPVALAGRIFRAVHRGPRRRPDGRQAEDRRALVREVRRIELTARRLVDSHALGNYASIFRGHGVEFSEVRAYEPGDPFQAIDWKVTARMRRPFVKRFVEERELTVLVAIDLSGSTDFGTRRRTKRNLAVELAAVLSLAALRSQDRVGLLLFTDRVEKFLRPVRGRNRTLRLIYDLLAFRPVGRGTDLTCPLEAASRLLPVRSLVFVISDFARASDDEETGGRTEGGRTLGGAGATGSVSRLEQALVGLARRHDVVAVEIVDPAEEVLPRAGLIEVADPETGARRVLDLGQPSVRASLSRHADEERERLAALFRRVGVERLRISTDRPYAADLYAFFAGRGRRPRVRGAGPRSSRRS